MRVDLNQQVNVNQTKRIYHSVMIFVIPKFSWYLRFLLFIFRRHLCSMRWRWYTFPSIFEVSLKDMSKFQIKRLYN